jgi:hypothetical protein
VLSYLQTAAQENWTPETEKLYNFVIAQVKSDDEDRETSRQEAAEGH